MRHRPRVTRGLADEYYASPGGGSHPTNTRPAQQRASPLLIYDDIHGASSSSASPLSQRSSSHSSSTISSGITTASSPSPYSDIQSFIHSYTDSCSLYSDSLVTVLGPAGPQMTEDEIQRSVRVSPIKSQDSGYSDSEEGGGGAAGRSQDFVSRVFVSSSSTTLTPPSFVASSQRIRANAVDSEKTVTVQTLAADCGGGGGESLNFSRTSPSLTVMSSPSAPLSPVRKVKTCRKCLQMAAGTQEQLVNGHSERRRRRRHLAENSGTCEDNKEGMEKQEVRTEQEVRPLKDGIIEAAPTGGLSRCPVAHWVSELPSLYDTECTNMLQSKAILAELSLSTLIMDNLRRVQRQGLEVTRLFATICRYNIHLHLGNLFR